MLSLTSLARLNQPVFSTLNILYNPRWFSADFSVNASVLPAFAELFSALGGMLKYPSHDEIKEKSR
jgi:hypothetical protein